LFHGLEALTILSELLYHPTNKLSHQASTSKEKKKKKLAD